MSLRECPLCHEILGLDAPEARPGMVGEGKLNGLATEPPVDAGRPEPLYRIIYAARDFSDCYTWAAVLDLVGHELRWGSPRRRPIQVVQVGPR